MNTEDQIRDYLCDHLGILEDNLSLVHKEFRLNNQFGAKGYIDILARDIYGNFVIIEIKRTKASSRETIQEILKYIALLKQNYGAKDGEIRTLIVAMEWSELLVPFSELVEKTSIAVKGLKIITDTNGLPLSCEKIQPLVSNLKRKFASRYSLYFFSSDADRKQAIYEISSQAISIGMTNFVLVEMDGNTDDQRLLHRFALCITFQQLSILSCMNILEKSERYVDEEIDFEDQEEELDYFNECLLIEIHEIISTSDGLEHATPKTIYGALSSGQWKTAGIFRYGFYSKDPRYDDYLLMRELMGLDGSNDQVYFNFCESDHTERLRDLITSSIYPVVELANWKKHIQSIFSYLAHQNERYRVVVKITTQPSILLALIKTLTSDEDYLPSYSIIVDFMESNKVLIFEGNIAWNGKTVDEDGFISYLQDDTDYIFISRSASVIQGYFEPQVLSKLQLRYQNYAVLLEKGAQKLGGQVKIKNNELVVSPIKDYELSDWLASCPNLLERAIIEVQSSTFGLV